MTSFISTARVKGYQASLLFRQKIKETHSAILATSLALFGLWGAAYCFKEFKAPNPVHASKEGTHELLGLDFDSNELGIGAAFVLIKKQS